MANVLILGGGFGGLVAAERLGVLVGPEHQVTLVAPNKRFTFYPALVHLAFGDCEEEDITFDMQAKLASSGIRFVQGKVSTVDPAKRTVHITGDDFSGDLAFDHILFAMGRRLAAERVPGFFDHAHHLLGIGAAQRFGERVREFREGTIIVGASPDSRLPVPVCETAFALARRFATEMRAGTVHVKVVFPESLQAAFGGAVLHEELESAFRRHGINVLYDVPVSEVTGRQVRSSLGHDIHHDLLMLIPPFQGQSMLNGLGITDEHGYIKVNGLMRVHGLAGAYAAGDAVAFSGPKFAHMAVRQAETAAANMAADIEGRQPPDEYYHEIATVIDAGGADSIYLHYGIWDDVTYRLKQGQFWGWAKNIHDKVWRARHN
jgi:sulfide:quinone oxidoreductase